MNWQYNPIIHLPIFAAVISAAIAIYVWRRESQPHKSGFIALMLAVAWWSVANALELSSADLNSIMLWSQARYFGIVTVPVAWLVFTLQYTGNTGWLQWRRLVLFLPIPITTLVITWTNGTHHLMWPSMWLEESGGFAYGAASHGVWFWVHSAYSYSLLFTGAALLVRTFFRASPLYRKQVWVLLVGTFVPWLGNILFLSGMWPLIYLDPTPLAFTVTGAIIAWGVFRLRLLEIIPAAHDITIASMNQAVIVLDAHGHIVDANPAAAKVFGTQNSEVIGRKLVSVMPEFKMLIGESDVVEDGLSELEFTRNSAMRSYESLVSSIHNRQGLLSGQVILLHDVTERRRAQEQLQELYERERALRQEREAEMQRRLDFTRILMHELVTPLTAIVTASELLADFPQEEPWMSLVNIVRRSAANLNRRISELLDVAKGEVGALQLEPEMISPLEFFHQAVESVTPILSSRKQSLLLELPPSLPKLFADKDRLQQILFNLIDNASKYSPEGGKITLRAIEKESSLLVSVHDTGSGLTLEEQRQLFNPYTRFIRDKPSTGGIGLGLAICKMLVELHGGQIWVESERDKGSTFTFALPLTLEKGSDSRTAEADS